jgi:hypothetical protein
MLRNRVSKKNAISISLVLLVLAAIPLALMSRAALAHPGEERNGQLHVMKECSKFTGTAGSYCTITSSNVPEIKAGSTVYYDQATVDPKAAEGGYITLDSNVVLYAGAGDWAVGRCSLDPTYHGLCTFSGGTGQFTGFHARVDVSPTGGVDFSWEGTYSFGPEH